MGFEILRTPENRFANLPDYNFSPHDIDCSGLRVHFVEEGEKTAPPVLLMHGEPTWSYLYRKMIPVLSQAGLRVIAPDLIGFGKSDKLARPRDYSYGLQVKVFAEFIRKLDLRGLTLFCQDWGGLIGLRVVAEEPSRFDRIIAANTSLPDAGRLLARVGPMLIRLMAKLEGDVALQEIGTGKNWYSFRPFLRWVAYSQTTREFPAGDIVQMGTVRRLTPEELAAYEAPFPDDRYKVGARLMPRLVATGLWENRTAWKRVLSRWKKPFLTAFSDRDPITRGIEKIFQSRIPGARHHRHVTIRDAGHFLQEDKGEELAKFILDFLRE